MLFKYFLTVAVLLHAPTEIRTRVTAVLHPPLMRFTQGRLSVKEPLGALHLKGPHSWPLNYRGFSFSDSPMRFRQGVWKSPFRVEGRLNVKETSFPYAELSGLYFIIGLI